jgi:hypothetical protein
LISGEVLAQARTSSRPATRFRQQAGWTVGAITSAANRGHPTGHDFGALDVLPAVVHDVLDGDSQALPSSDQVRFEHALDSAFGHVRIHTGPRAAASANAVGALAYSYGSHVVLGDEARPGTVARYLLLGHELAHVAAIGGDSASSEARSVSPSSTAEERDAGARGALAALGLKAGRPPRRGDRRAIHRFEKSERGQIASLTAVIATAKSIAEKSMVTSLLVNGIDWPTFTKNAGGFDIGDYLLLKTTGSASASAKLPNRYLFTCGCGLVDMRHFYQLMYIAMVRSNSKATEMGRSHELTSEPTSRFAPEDTPSNALGAFFGTQLPFTMQPGAFAAQLQAYLSRCGPADFTAMSAPDQDTIVNFYGERNPDGTPKNPNETAQPAVLAVPACGGSRSFPFIVEPDKRTITDTEHLKSDSEIRDWIGSHDGAIILGIPTSEKVRLVNRLLDGWVSDDDITAIEKIVANASAGDKPALKAAIDPRIADISSVGQRTSLRLALKGL